VDISSKNFWSTPNVVETCGNSNVNRKGRGNKHLRRLLFLVDKINRTESKINVAGRAMRGIGAKKLLKSRVIISDQSACKLWRSYSTAIYWRADFFGLPKII